MATLVTDRYVNKLVSCLKEKWQEKLVLDLYNKWQNRAVVEHTTMPILRFSPKSGGKWFAIMKITKSGKLTLSVSDYRETINIDGLRLERAPGEQFEKSEYGERRAVIDRESQVSSVHEAFQEAYALKA